jgi:hypothetical protein
VLPGLVDAHAHLPPDLLPGQVELFAYLFLRHGVTGVRVPGDVSPGVTKCTRERIDAGEFAGPRLAACGRFIDGPNPVFESAIVVSRDAEARAAVDKIAAEGFDCVKVYNELDAVSLAAIRDAAETHGLPVIGHIPWRLTFEESELDDVQHMLGFHQRHSADPFESMSEWFNVSDARIEEVIAAALRSGTAMTTTLVAAERISRARESAVDPDDPMRRWLPPWYADALWRIPGGINAANRLEEGELKMLRDVSALTASIVPKLYRAGVVLRAGTDTFAPPIVPGASLHRELELYVEAGLSPEEALEIATRGSAGALSVPRLGALEVGAPADLLVFREDPTRDLAALDTLLAVVQDGRLYTREMLDAQELRYRENFDGFFQQRIALPAVRAGLGPLLRHAMTSPDEAPD